MRKRTPGMYHFYFNEITEAIHNNDYDRVDYLVSDAPKEVKKALIRNEVIEGSVEETRRDDTLEEHLRTAIIVLNEQGYLADRAWPESYEFEELLEAAKEIERADEYVEEDSH